MTLTRNTLTVLAVLSLAGLAHAAAPERVEIRGFAAPAAELQGEYALADGRLMAVRQRGTRLLAQIDGETAVALSQGSGQSWTSVDGRLTVDFHAAANGSVRGITLKRAR
jgi:hypothetical protein